VELASVAEQVLCRSVLVEVLAAWGVFKPRGCLLRSWGFLVLFTGVGVQSNPKRKIVAVRSVARFSYLNSLNAFMGVLCFSYSLPKTLHAVLLFLLNSCHI